MTTPDQIILLAAFSISIFAAIFCAILLSAKQIYSSGENGLSRKTQIYTIYFYLILVLYHVCTFFLNYAIGIFLNISSLFYLVVLLASVGFYHIIFLITRLHKDEVFPYKHYIFPVILYLTYTTWSLFVPDEIRVGLPTKEIYIADGYEWFCGFHYLRILIRSIFIIVYFVLSVRRVLTYRKSIIHYSANMEASSLRWIYEVLLIYLVTYVPIPVLFLLSAPGSNIEYLTKISFNCFAFIFDIILCYNIFTNNYVLTAEDIVTQEKEAETGNYGSLNKKELESFIKKQKPFLDYNLKITDLALSLGTNRTYLSRFINDNYQLSFSMYINKCRLEELEKIKKSASYADLSEEELIYLVGFKSFNSYKKTREVLE